MGRFDSRANALLRTGVSLADISGETDDNGWPLTGWKPMTLADEVVLALTCWRENRGGGYAGMQSVANVVLNRAAHRGTSPYVECTRAWQFTSITGKGDSQLTVWPPVTDPQWKMALSIASDAAEGSLPDITNGSTLYYNPSSIATDKTIELPTGETIPFPKTWDPHAVEYVKEIQGHRFFRG